MSAAAPPDASAPPVTDSAELLDAARGVLRTEADAVAALAERLDDRFAACCRLLAGCEGRVAVLGMGKSGHVAQKLAATFASTGTLAFFVHPAEAGHGDLGMLAPGDAALALSNSGETPELLELIPQLRRLKIPLLALTGNPESTLARRADLCLDAAVAREACPLNLAPTASTTAALALGDALAVALMHMRGFRAEDFARSHPGGDLGRRLLTTAGDLMRGLERTPRVALGTLLRDALPEISEKGLGMTTVLDAGGALAGVFTDGDLRRCLAEAVDVHATAIDGVMTREFLSVDAGELAVDVLLRMRDRRVTAVPVLRGGALAGALNMHDLIAAGIR